MKRALQGGPRSPPRAFDALPRTTFEDRTGLDHGWVGAVRRVPVGILFLAVALALLGAGSVLGAAYLAAERRELGWMPVLAGVGAGPLAIYVAVHLVRRTHWAWQALVLLLILLLLSSLWRVVATPPPVLSPVAEVVFELLSLAYLSRPRVRAAFARR